jgi:large subunit ribosomal protein L31
MRTNIHPEYIASTVRCACGNIWQTRATRSQMQVEACSRCHPFFTGEKRIVDAAGRVERFKRRYGMSLGPDRRLVI